MKKTDNFTGILKVVFFVTFILFVLSWSTYLQLFRGFEQYFGSSFLAFEIMFVQLSGPTFFLSLGLGFLLYNLDKKFYKVW